MTSTWNFADVWEAVSDRFPDHPALIHGNLEISWKDFDQHADGVAAAMIAAGLRHQAKVAQYMRNGPAYLESLFAAFKAGLVPVNTNYRYGDEELRYLWTNSDSEAVVFDAEFTTTCDRLRPQLPEIRLWLRVGGEDECPDWATDYQTVTDSRPGRVLPPWGRSGDDLYLLFTGGTTGMPKGVMWRQDDLFRMLEAPYGRWADGDADASAWADNLTRPNRPILPAPPLMHGTGCWFCLPVLNRAGTIVTLTSPSLDADELLDTLVARDVQRLCIVGEAFAKPILQALEAEPDRWDLSALRMIVSSGAILSAESKKRLVLFAPNAALFDGLGSSESGSVATSVTDTTESTETARFRLSDHTRVFDEHGHDVVPGSGKAGRLAVGGYLPLGYYKDPEKTAATFVEVDGRRYVIAGDWAEVDDDRAIRLLGRGSSCINTAGEKVYPEEVEEVLKQADIVRDAAVVGVPDDRFGQRVIALVELEQHKSFNEQVLIDHVKRRLAAYKAPRAIIMVESLDRGPNGKLDHRHLSAVAVERTTTNS